MRSKQKIYAYNFLTLHACLFYYPIYSFVANYLFDLPKIINLPINFLHIYSSDLKVCKMSRAGVERAEKILVRMGIGYAGLAKTLQYSQFYSRENDDW